MLDPALALYSRAETEYLLREDPRITHRSLYYDILGAMASGASTASSIGSLLGGERGAMTHPLDILESTGYVTRSEDILRPRKPKLTLTDPIVRFNQLITLPYAPLIEDGHAAEAWSAGRPTFHAKILGPHFEELTRIWTRRHARDEADGLEIGPVGSAEIYDAKTRTKHEVDVLALAPGERPHSPRARITLLGEAKATLSPRGPTDLDRLDRIRTLIGEQGHDVHDTKLALFSLHGFDRNLHAAAAARDAVLLIELSHLRWLTPRGDGSRPLIVRAARWAYALPCVRTCAWQTAATAQLVRHSKIRSGCAPTAPAPSRGRHERDRQRPSRLSLPLPRVC